MNLSKIMGLVGVVLAIAAAFVAIPFAGALLAVLGLIVGWNYAAENHVRVIVSALALSALAKTFDTLPAVGPAVSAILGNFGSLVAGVALMIILNNMYLRLKA